MEEELASSSGTSLGQIAGAVGALFGIAGSLSQATAAKRAVERANEEAAIAVAQARDSISKMPVLEKGIPVLAIDQIQKDSLRQRKQLLDAVRGSGQRAVLGAVPTIGEQILTQEEKQRGVVEKQLQAREDEIVKAEQAKQDLELQMLTASGAAARQRAASAARQGALAVGAAGRSAAALGGEILEGSDLFGGEKRRFNRALNQFIEGQGEGVSENFDREGFVDYLNTREESLEDLTEMLKDPNNTLFADFALETGTESTETFDTFNSVAS
tara:strand:- start:521 stop:1333 length:813 start_codon:yes stop_codon:yes gene_type:complete